MNDSLRSQTRETDPYEGLAPVMVLTENPPVPVAAPAEPSPQPGGRDRTSIDALTRFAISISLFTILGHVWLGFEQAPITPIACLVFAYVLAFALESAAAWSAGRRPAWEGGRQSLAGFVLPVHIAAVATAMLLYANSSLWPYLFAISIALGSKYLVRVRVGAKARHVLNPSNVGIAVTLLCFPWVGIAPPYQYTARIDGWLDWALPAVILAFGSVLNVKLTGRAYLIGAWLTGFVLQAVFRAVFFDAALVAALVPLTGTTMVLYTNYMITDPGTTPASRRGQVVFGLSNAAIYGVLMVFNVAFGLFFALVLTCVGRGIVLLSRRSHR